MRHLFLFSTFIFLFTYSIAQNPTPGNIDSSGNSYTDISKVELEKKIQRQVSSSYSDKKTNLEKEFAAIKFIPGLQHTGAVPVEFVTKKIILKFNIFNSADTTISVYFCPGFYYTDINLYRIEKAAVEALPSVLANSPNSIGYRNITLPGHDSATIIAELSFVKTYNNAIRPRLIHAGYLAAFIAELHSSYKNTDLITYVFCGLLLMMMLFSVTNFLQGANHDFLYYSGYAFFLGGMLFIQTIFHFRTNLFGYLLEGYLDFVLQGAGIIFYMLFMQRFLNTRNNHPFLYKLYNAGISTAGYFLSCIYHIPLFHRFLYRRISYRKCY